MEIKKTITSVFITPIFKIDRDKLSENGFINSYIKDGYREVQYENCIYLLFKPNDVILFNDFVLREKERTSSLIDDYDYDGGYVVLVYQFDDKWKKDIEIIKTSKYSKTSKEFQALFPKIVKIKKNGLHKDEISIQYRVFNKTEDLLHFREERLGVTFDDEQEVWYAFIEENETLNLNKIKEYV